MEANYGMDPWIWQSLDGPSFLGTDTRKQLIKIGIIIINYIRFLKHVNDFGNIYENLRKDLF